MTHEWVEQKNKEYHEQFKDYPQALVDEWNRIPEWAKSAIDRRIADADLSGNAIQLRAINRIRARRADFTRSNIHDLTLRTLASHRNNTRSRTGKTTVSVCIALSIGDRRTVHLHRCTIHTA